MILVFDNNQYRLEKTCRNLRNEDLPTKGASYEDCEYHTTPIITVLVCPNPREIKYLTSNLTRQGTVCVLVLKKSIPEAKCVRNVIIDPDAKITATQIKEIMRAEYGYTLEEDVVNDIYISHADREIYFIGTCLGVQKREFSIIRFFAYNRKKIFTIDDILEYLHLKIKPESFNCYVSTINGRCRSVHREDIILRDNFGYGITPVTGHFELQDKELKKALEELKKLAYR